MKIAFLNIYQHSVERGAESFVLELTKRLESADITIISQDLKSVDLLGNSNFLTKRLFLDYRSRNVARFTLKYLLKIYKQKYDIVVPLNGGWQAILVRLVTWTYGGKMVVSGQSGIGWDDRINLYSFPNIFVALTDYQAKWAKKINPFVNVVTIPNGVDLKKFTPLTKKGKANTVLVVSALVKQKRLDLLIRAISKLENIKLIIIGKGEEEKNLKELGDKFIPGRLTIKSSPYNEISSWYKKADIFSYPTIPQESFGIVLLEAMASGLPIVATSDPIRRQIIGEAGILVDPRDSEAYAKAIKAALEKSWGGRPRQQAEKFSWDSIAKQYEELFNNLK